MAAGKGPSENKALTSAFLSHLMAERGLSPNTIEGYSADIAEFAGFLARKRIGLAGAGRADVAAFMAGESRRGLCAASVARRLACLKSLYKFLFTERLVPEDPAKDVPMPRLPERLPSNLRREEVASLIQDGPGGPQALRDRAILETFYATGLRVSELAGLKMGDVNFEDGFVRARGKGSKERMVPLGRPAIEALQSYFEATADRRPEKGFENCPVFLSRKGGSMGREALFRVVKKAADRAGTTRKVSPHTLRHTFATHLVAGGADLRAVQEMLGHSSVATTQVYTHVENSWLKDVHKKFHPRN